MPNGETGVTVGPGAGGITVTVQGGSTGISFVSLPDADQNGIIEKCASAACRNAQTALQSSRNNILQVCATLGTLRAQLSFLANLLSKYSTLAILYAGLATAAFVEAAVAGPYAGYFIALGLFFLSMSGYYSYQALGTQNQINSIRSQLQSAYANLAAAQQAFQNAVAEVEKNCTPYCYPDLDMPTCS